MESRRRAVVSHCELYIGPVTKSVEGPIELHWIAPGRGRADWVIFTAGMADDPMPDGRRTELVLRLPDGWTPSWAVDTLLRVAALPREQGMSFALGGSIPNGQPPAPYGCDTDYVGMWLVAPDVLWPRDVDVLDGHPGEEIEFLQLFPLYADELDFKATHGLRALVDRATDRGLSGLVVPNRPSLVAA